MSTKEVFLQMAYIKSFPNQTYLIPPKITDLFSKNHVCYLIEQICSDMDYSEFDDKFSGAGHPAYHPRINLKILLMGHADGIHSSRKLAKSSQENVVYIYLSEKVKPNFRTINEFRKNNKKLVKSFMRELNSFAYEEGLIDLSQLNSDGTTIRANASDFKTIKKKQLEKIDRWIDRYMEEADRIDEEEDKIYGDRGMHELPEGLVDPKKREPKVKEMIDRIKESMKKKDTANLKQIKQEVKQIQNFTEEQKVKQFSFIDSDARFMLSKKGRIELSYNAQLVVDNNGIIVANNVVQDRDDRNQLVPNINKVEENFGQLPEGTIITADAGYEKGESLAELESRGFNVFVPGKNMKPESKEKKFAKANFTYNEENDEYICPNNKILTNRGKYIHAQKKAPMTIYTTSLKICRACPDKQACCKNAKSRKIHATPENKLLYRMKLKLNTEEGKAIYRFRKQTVERSFGDIKHNKKFRRFLLRGLEKVKIEFDLTCIAHNLVLINNLINRKNGNLAGNC